MSLNVMREDVFRDMVGRSAVSFIGLRQVVAEKGKPAKAALGSAPVWAVQIEMGGQVFDLEAARGGIREWASLDRLVRWLRQCGVRECTIRIDDVSLSGRQGELRLEAEASEELTTT
jgi:hypothetical protein